jgi:hypothetical protein
MKASIILFLIVTLLAGRTTHAQAEFAPIGAEWYYSGNSYDYMFFWQEYTINEKWVDHMRSVKDTLVADIACRKLELTRHMRNGRNPDSLYFAGIRNIYIYDREDTVYAYNDWMKQFTPLYVFTAEDGDTVCMPHFKPGYGLKDTFCYIVDSVREVLYDQVPLRTWYTRAINQSDKWGVTQSYNWGTINWDVRGEEHEWVNSGQYARKLGHNADAGLDAEVPSGWMNCYSDSSYKIKMTPGACDLVPFPRSGIRETSPLLKNISVYPNPVHHRFYIHSEDGLPIPTRVDLFDLTGRKVASWSVVLGRQALEYDVPDLPDGIYLLQLCNAEGNYYRKLLLQRR